MPGDVDSRGNSAQARLREWGPTAALVLLATLPFLSGVGGPFLSYDDKLYLFSRETTLFQQQFLAVWDSTPAWTGEFVEFFPLRDSIYWLLYRAFGFDALAFHLTTLAFHVIASLLALQLLRELGASRWVAFAAAALFAAHPTHVESIQWAAGLKDPLYTSFFFATLLSYQKYRLGNRPRHLAAALIFFVCSLLAKSMSVGVPLILIAIELLFPPRVPWKTIVSRVMGFVVISALFLTQFILIGKASGNVVTPHGGSWGAHFFLTAWAQVLYLKQAFLPGDLRLLYCLAPMTGPTDFRLFVIGLVLVVLAGALLFWRRSSHVLFGAVLYFVCLGPASNLVPFPSLMADRYLYAASLGTCLILALALNGLPERVRPLSLGALLLALAFSSAWRSLLWHSEETLWAESDEDPECLLDTNFPAAQVHALRAMSSRDPETRLLAFERSIASAGYAKMKSCTIPRDGALAALSLNLPERARPFSALSVQHCGSEPQTWVIAMAISIHKDKAAAADAAQHAWRLANDPRTRLYKALTELEYVGTGADEVSAAISHDAAQLCPLLMPWAEEVDALVATAVAEPLERCRRLGERGSK